MVGTYGRVVAGARAEEALEVRDAAEALHWIDQVPDDLRPGLALRAWMIAGSPRAVKHVMAELAGDDVALAERFIADDGASDEAPDVAYAALEALRDEHAKRGRARALARVHLAMADKAPRPDWRWLHVEHASSLARALGDARLDALVLAHEALRDAEFGEDEDALERAEEALHAGEAANEERAIAIARWAEAQVRARPQKDEGVAAVVARETAEGS